MKEKFIRIISPITALVVILLDAAVAGYGIYAIKRIIAQRSTAVILFFIIEVFAIVIAAMMTKEVCSNGVIFYKDKLEFTGIDSDNVFNYCDITAIKAIKDENASLTKNFTDRHAKLIITQSNESITEIDIGLCTKRTLEKIAKEICNKSNIQYTPLKKNEKAFKPGGDSNKQNRN